MSNRLARYRALNDRLRLTSPVSALEKKLYIKRPGLTAADEIVAHMEPSPASAVALVGGIGSGKTTELLLAAERLSQVEATTAWYIDVSALHDLDQLEHGVLLAAVGLKLCEEVEKTFERGRSTSTPSRTGDHKRLIKWFCDWAANQFRHELSVDEDFYEHQQEFAGYKVLHGKLSVPHQVTPDVAQAFKIFLALKDIFLIGNPGYLMVMLDGLDRVSNMQAFGSLMDKDLRLLQKAEVGVVLTAPLISLYGQYRPLLERFEHVVHLPPLDVDTSPEARDFLAEVLAVRDPHDVVSASARRFLAQQSGGILRDMLMLCADAARVAYGAGADTIDEKVVRIAAIEMGRTRWMGLSPSNIQVLRGVLQTGRFNPSSDEEMALLMTRRVLEYPQLGQEPRFAVHPVLTSLLQQSAKVPS